MLKFEHARDRREGRKGKTIVIDFGPEQVGWSGRHSLADLLEAGGVYIDYAKIWALNAVTLPEPFLRSVIELYQKAGVHTFAGGLLFEYAFMKNEIDGMIELLQHLEIEGIEVSENYLVLSRDERLKAIEQLSRASITVVYEFGRKQPETPMTVDELEQVVLEVKESGSHHVIVEQSEFDLLEEIDPAAVDSLCAQEWFDDVYIEADPYRYPKQLADLVKRFGPEVNLANVALGQVMRLEAFRRGLGRTIDFPLLRDMVAARNQSAL